jgi:hypothetical protein
VATGAHAVDWISKATGILPATVFRTARALREADPTLWPKAAKGGGRGAAHLERRHLVNLALALAVADPINAAPKVVAGYRALVRHRPQHVMQPEHTGRAARLLTGVFGGADDLGGDLERLVELLADGAYHAINDQLVTDILREAGLCVELVVDPRVPRARVTFHGFDLPDDLATHTETLLYRPRNTPRGLSKNLDPAWTFLPPATDASIIRTAILPVSLFIVLAALWDTTRRYRGETPLGEVVKQIQREAHKRKARERRRSNKRQSSPSQPDAPASATPENETAASPAREAAAARDQPAEADGCSVQAHPTGEREKSQSPSALRLGHSQQPARRRTDAEERKVAAFDPAA